MLSSAGSKMPAIKRFLPQTDGRQFPHSPSNRLTVRCWNTTYPIEPAPKVREEMKRIKPGIPVLLFAGIDPQTPILLRFFDAYLQHEGQPPSEPDGPRT